MVDALPVHFYRVVDDNDQVRFAQSNITPAPAGWTEITQETYSSYLSAPDQLPYLYWRDGEVVYEPPGENITVPTAISRRQFFQGLAVARQITENEAIAAVATGTLPEAIENVIDTLPTDDKFAARMALVAATEIQINHSLTLQFAASKGWNQSQVNDFFVLAGGL